MQNIGSKNIVFVTGAFVHNSTWDEWKAYFAGKGYTTVAPPWPHKNAPAKVLRERLSDPGLTSLRFSQLVDHYADIARQFPEKPILIGHSTGGLIVQLLLQRGLASAGVAIHSLPPQGIIPLQFSFWRAGWKSLGLLTSTRKLYMMSFPDWQYAFTNGIPFEQQKISYEKYAVPESKRVVRGALTKAARVDFARPHAPLLFTSGSDDHLIPAPLNFRNFKKYTDKNSVTDYKEFAGRNHFVLGQPTWKEDAEYILNWINAHSRKEAREYAPAAGR